MKTLAVGILAHVDAGKTTLSEALLYHSGRVRKLGRVDHGDAFFDSDSQERERGITIFSKQAVVPLGNTTIHLLDTPGHVDFSTEMERTLQVLDYAILVIGGSEGVQSHTRTLWRLLQRYQIPTIIFVNKMDLHGAEKDEILRQLHRLLDGGCVDFDQPKETLWEQVALCDEGVLESYLESGQVNDEAVQTLVAQRKLFPCYFGSALKNEGVAPLVEGIERYTKMPQYPPEFGAKVYKIARDSQGARLTYVKITGGSLSVKTLLEGQNEPVWSEKVDQIRIYSGQKFQTVEWIAAGGVCVLTGLSHTAVGDGLGSEVGGLQPLLEPVLTYRMELPPQCDPHIAMSKLAVLVEEDPQLKLNWNRQLQEIHVQLMGEIQLEVLSRLIFDRFGWAVTFGQGNIVYRETIAKGTVGLGHFEPLRHYAEVHLLLEPGERGSGLRLATTCAEDCLGGHWQRLILSHLVEKAHPGVLVGAPITDMKITLTAGGAHAKHTEGGDFRQATYRALRQGLMSTACTLLEPFYDFRLELPQHCVGRAMTDLQRMDGQVEPPETVADEVVLTGRAPVSTLRGYHTEVAAYTKGLGKLMCTPWGYDVCHNQAQVLAESNYDPLADVEYPADSVFCAHGAGFTVKWDKVKDYIHLDVDDPNAPIAVEEPVQNQPRRSATQPASLAQDKELQAIFERTYGPIKERYDPFRTPRKHSELPDKVELSLQKRGPEYLLVDGYNIIFGWDELKEVAQEDLESARQMLMDILSNYQGYRGCEVILVFDAYKVARNTQDIFKYQNIHVVFTKEAETADTYIEKTTYKLAKDYRVRVATSDGAEQMIILGHGALRLSAAMLQVEVEQVEGSIQRILQGKPHQNRTQSMKKALEAAEKKRDTIT